MRFATLTFALLTATGAQGHPGHLAEVAGHGHWLGAAAIGAAIAIGLWGALKGRKDAAASAEDDTADETPEDELQEA